MDSVILKFSESQIIEDMDIDFFKFLHEILSERINEHIEKIKIRKIPKSSLKSYLKNEILNTNNLRFKYYDQLEKCKNNKDELKINNDITMNIDDTNYKMEVYPTYINFLKEYEIFIIQKLNEIRENADELFNDQTSDYNITNSLSFKKMLKNACERNYILKDHKTLNLSLVKFLIFISEEMKIKLNLNHIKSLWNYFLNKKTKENYGETYFERALSEANSILKKKK